MAPASDTAEKFKANNPKLVSEFTALVDKAETEKKAALSSALSSSVGESAPRTSQTVVRSCAKEGKAEGLATVDAHGNLRPCNVKGAPRIMNEKHAAADLKQPG